MNQWTQNFQIISMRNIISTHKKLILATTLFFLLLGVYSNVIKKKSYTTNFTLTSYLVQTHLNEAGQPYKRISTEDFAKYIIQFNDQYNSTPKFQKRNAELKSFRDLKKIAISGIYGEGIDVIMYVYDINKIDSIIHGLFFFLENTPYIKEAYLNEKNSLTNKISKYKQLHEEMELNKNQSSRSGNLTFYGYNVYHDLMQSSQILFNLQNNLNKLNVAEFIKRPMVPIIDKTKIAVNIFMFLLLGLFLGITMATYLNLRTRRNI